MMCELLVVASRRAEPFAAGEALDDTARVVDATVRAGVGWELDLFLLPALSLASRPGASTFAVESVRSQ